MIKSQLFFICFALLFLITIIFGDSKYDVLKEDWCGEDNCYDLLGVIATDEFRTIKVAYNNISLVLHPDKNPNATEEQKQTYVKVNKAYEILSNAESRGKYDEYLRLKSSMDSPREHPLFVLLLLYIGITFVVLQYQKQRHKNIRNGILDLPIIQQWFQRNKNIDLTGKKKKRRTRGKKGRNKKGNKSNSNSNLLDVNDDNIDDSNKPIRDIITNGFIDEALRDTNTIVEEWNSDEPSMQKAAIDVPLFLFKMTKIGFNQLRWQIKYTLLKQNYTNSDKELLCRTHFQKSETEWYAMTQKERQTYLDKRGIWNVDNKKNK